MIDADWPDVVIGCTGGGSNFAGIAFPFVRENIVNGKQTRIVAVEPAAAPSLTRGVYAYDFGDTAQMTPLMKMHTLGHDFVPAPIHAGGLRYHGMAAQVSALKEAGLIEARQRPAARDLRRRHELHRAPRASCPRPNRPTPSWARCRKRWPARRAARARPSSSTSAATATSTWPPTTPTCRASWWTTSIPTELVEQSLANLPQVG